MYVLLEIIKLLFLTLLIVSISKYLLVVYLRKLSETLNLKPKTVGTISGIATSVPELLTVSFSSYIGLVNTSIYNILSSNIINLILYLFSIVVNKNFSSLKNKAIKIDIILVIFTILIPLIILLLNIKISIAIVPFFILLFIFFYLININTHNLYLKKEENLIYENIQKEEKWLKGKKNKTIKYIIYLIIICILLFVIGNSLSNILENLCVQLSIPELIIGILLGVITSIPELITFIEAQKHHKKQQNIQSGVVEATNNLLSSNILNLFIIQSIGILIYSLIVN